MTVASSITLGLMRYMHEDMGQHLKMQRNKESQMKWHNANKACYQTKGKSKHFIRHIGSVWIPLILLKLKTYC